MAKRFDDDAKSGDSRPRRAHLVGIAGTGMRALADVLLGWGWRLSGSDLNIAPVQSLAAAGVRLFQGHDAGNLPDGADEVVYSDAVPVDNPERRRAAERDIPASSYFQMLGRLGNGRRTVAVAGTHGKSTVTAMAAHLLVAAARDPTVVCGATPLGATSGGRAGGSRIVCGAGVPPALCSRDGRTTKHEVTPERPLMLVEACEYRANFLHLRPEQAAILGIELDHFDCYDSLEQLEGAFRRFAASLPAGGLLVARHDCPSTRRVTPGVPCRVETFGFSPDADWSARIAVPYFGTGFGNQGQFSFKIRRFGEPLCDVRLHVPGEHNVLNALAAAAIAYENGVTGDQISAGLGSFPGLHRRLEMLGTWRGATLIDDYAHHPTEVAAALQAVRQMFPHARVWCVFQPHQASRTQRLLEELAASLQNADKVLVAEIFRAREGDPRPGEATAADLARRAAGLGVEVLPGHTAEEIIRTLETQLAPGDVLVTLGAGDVEKLRPPLDALPG